MYFLFGILVLISFVFVILFSYRKKKKILCRLACMNPCEKENLLNSQKISTHLPGCRIWQLTKEYPRRPYSCRCRYNVPGRPAGMYYERPVELNGLNQLGVNYGITAIPAGSAGAFSPEGGCSYMLTKGADDATRAAVYKFMAYWLSDATLKEWSNRNGFPVWSY